MKKKTRLPAVLALSLLTTLGVGALPARASDTDLQQWTQLTFQTDLSKQWIAFFEVQPRLGDDVSELNRLIVRPAIGYRLRPNVSIWQGYGWTPQFSPEFRDEHRSFQQLLMEHRVHKTDVVNRTRLEQRFIEDAGGTSVRLRHMVRLVHPLTSNRKWSLVGSDEVFWNLNSTPNGPEAGFDQNRLFFGVNHRVNPQLQVEAGYLINQIDAPRSNPNQRLNVIYLGMFYRM